jgi:hypothetical protein
MKTGLTALVVSFSLGHDFKILRQNNIPFIKIKDPF